MTTPKPLTMAEYDKLTPGEQGAWNRHLLRSWEQNAVDAELRDHILDLGGFDGMGEEIDRQDRHGAGDV